MNDAADTATDTDDRRRRLLDAAAALFLRFGFKKTSMEEVARAAGFSRQGLYFHFATKEDLLRAAVQHVLISAVAAASARLEDDDVTVEAQLVGGFDAWLGPFIGIVGEDASDLAAVAKELVAAQLAECSHLFVDAVTKHLRSSGLAAAYKPTGLTARQLAETLYATGRGLKQGATREAFLDGLTVAVRAFCVPLRLTTTRTTTTTKAPNRQRRLPSNA